MAAGRKEYELLMKLTAALGSNFNSTFQTAMNTTKKLQDSLSSLKKVQGDITSYKKTQDAIAATKNSVQELVTRHGTLQQKLAATTAREKELQKALDESGKKTGTSTEEYLRLEAALKKTQGEKARLTTQANNTSAAITRANNEIENEENKLADLSQKLQAAGVNTSDLTAETERLDKAYERVQKSQESLSRVNKAIDENKAAISATRGELAKTMGVVTAGGAAFYAGAIKPAIEFESAMAGVKKTINGTPEQLLAIQNGIRKMSTEIPLGTTEIAAIAESAGQLGIKTESILGFTRTMADLGVTTNLAGEEAASTLAKFANITGMSQGNFDRLGSTIVALGNNLATTEADIAAMSLRLAGAGSQVGLSEAQILSFAGALSSVGIEAEAGGSAFSKVMVDMQLAVETNSERLTSFANVADVSAADFKRAFQEDAAGAMQMFIKGLGESEEKGVSAIKVLDDMEISEVRMRDALLRAAGASDKFAESLAIGSKAWEENSALAKEAQQRYATTESSIAIMKNAFNDIGISLGSVFLPSLATAAQKVSELAVKFSEFAQENPELIKTLMGVVGGLAAVKVGSLAGKLGFLEMKGGVLEVVQSFLGFRANMAETAAEAATKGKTLAGYFNGVKDAAGGLGGSIDKLAGGKLSGVFSKVGGGIQNGILKPLGGIGNKVTGALSPVGGKITGFFGGIGQKVAAGPLGKIGGVFSSIGKTAGAVLGGPLKGLGSLFGGLFGKAMPIIMILSALSILFMQLSGKDTSAFIKPLKDAFEQLKPVLAAAMEQFKALGKQILPLIMDAVKQLAPLLGQIITAILPVVLQLIQSIVPLIVQLVQQLLPPILNIITSLAPLLTQIITAILPIVVQLLQTLLPIITQLVTAVLPVIVSVLNTLMPIITQLIQAVLPVLMSILQALMPVIQVLADLFSTVLGAAIAGIKPIIDAVMTVFSGLIDFITGVFTGNWGKAWEGVKNIFKGIVDGLVGIFKFPINLIIEGINFFLSGLNKLKIPDWVPGIGGKGINIPLIPKLETGSLRTPDTFIAGDVNGKGGELVTGAQGRRVFTAAETSAIFENISAAKAINNASVPGPSATDAPPVMPTIAERVSGFMGALKGAAANRAAEMTAGPLPAMPTSGGGEQSFIIQYSPTIYIDGNTPGDLEEKLKQNNENLLQMFKEFLRGQREDERRMGYA